MSDDILNNEDLLGKKNIKKPLIYGAVAFLVFVVGVIGFALLQNSDSKKNEIVPPEVKKEVTIESQFKPLMIEENPQEIKKEVTQKPNQAQIKPEIKPTEEIKPEIKPEVKEEKEVKPAVKEVVKEVKKVEPKKETKKETKKEAIKNGKYYIQVAALLRYSKPNKNFLNLIKKEGFNYRLYNTYIVKNKEKIKVTKILVGPFNSKKEAKEALKRVKATISQSAFIFKVK